MIPDWLTYLFAFIGALHFVALTGLFVWFTGSIVATHIRARRAARKIMAALERQKAEDERWAEHCIKAEWFIREVAEEVEGRAA